MTSDDFADAVGEWGDVQVVGAGTSAPVIDRVRSVSAPSDVIEVHPAEMTIRCGAGTPVDEVSDALRPHGQRVVLPAGGTVGGRLAVGRSDLRRLADGAMRDSLLQARYVDADGRLVTAGGPTVKNVSGFDLCRLLVGSWGTLGFLADVILRTRPIAPCARWFLSERDPWDVLAELYRPSSVLWNGECTWVLLEGHPTDVDDAARRSSLREVDGPPLLPTGGRWSMPAAQLATLRSTPSGTFVAEVGVGVVHHSQPPPARRPDPDVVALHARIKTAFDPTGRLNPGIDPLAPPHPHGTVPAAS